MASKQLAQVRDLDNEAEPTVESLEIAKILCPLDFSDFSRESLRYAVGLARHFRARLLVQHTAEIPQTLLMTGAEPSAMATWRDQLPEFANDARRLLKEMRVKDSEAKVIVNEGLPLDRILDTIRQERVDRKSTRLNSSHIQKSRMPSSA